MSLSSIIDGVTGNERTLTVYDPEDPAAIEDVERHFAVQNVTVERATAPVGPDDFAVLHDDGEFLSAADLGKLRDAVSFRAGLLDADEFERTRYPEILTHVDDATFTAYGKQRMVLASREIEERAWREGNGELHAGFQRLSLLADQWDLYSRIADRGVDVHVYGAPDWKPPETDRFAAHPSESDEIRDAWFVAFQSPDGGDCALVAVEEETDEFRGFWSYDGDIVGDVFDHLRDRYGTDSGPE
ncbi:histidine kinase (plasmid) [Halorussus salilacus]|uniref:DICT sensory domain-containing protein n=1 Tax=Halorussus salilacus TaxID=2953750 RepID=UPI0020A00F17|nr:DICT sensory domain-containing protein [Halorussus salilacus]USZ69703.1 histidine kinase [Halorussus salilacus]